MWYMTGVLASFLVAVAAVAGSGGGAWPAGVIGQVVARHLSSCRLVLVGADRTVADPSFTELVRVVSQTSPGVVVVEAALPSATQGASTSLPRQTMASDAKFPCRVYIVHVAAQDNSSLEFLAAAGLDVAPGTRVVGFGDPALARELLDHPALRNTAHALYLAAPPAAATTKDNDVKEEEQESVMVISRCHYCDHGHPENVILDYWHPLAGFEEEADLFPDQFEDCHGHTFQVVSMDWFPFLSFTRDSQRPGTTVTPQDSVDVRMLSAVARTLNFTYVMRVPEDGQWGVQQERGGWSGTVGTLQRRFADFSMLLNWSSLRLTVIDFSRIYAAEPLVILSTQPRPRPHYLALIAPFAGEVWYLLLGVSLWGGAVHWGMQRARRHLHLGAAGAVGARVDPTEESCGAALLYTTGLLLQNPPFRPPKNLTAQVLVGWWLVFGLLMAAMYRSSLIAHLSVPARSAPVDTFEQLVGRAGWTWGLEPTYGAEWEWFRSSVSPTVRSVFQGIQVLETEEHLRRVMEGRHALLTWKFYIQSLVVSRFTDASGYTPLYIGRSQHYVSTGYGWGFRKGAPFRHSIDATKQRLLEAGLVNYWLNDLIEASGQKARMERKAEGRQVQERAVEEGERVVLSVGHLQTALYLLLLGCLGSCITLLGEVAWRR